MRIRRRRAQSAVEVMLLVPVIMMVFMSMYYLWSITFAAQNCHMRAREYVFHGNTYLSGRGQGTSGSTPFSGTDYQNAGQPGSFRFTANSSDTSIAGVGDSGVNLQVTAVITSN